MASGFLYLEDGRCFAPKMSLMVHLLDLINNEIKKIEGANLFSNYLDHFIPKEHDEPNGYGGFIRNDTGENIMLVLDLREFAEENRMYFWNGAQSTLDKLLYTNGEQMNIAIESLKKLLDMHKRTMRGESPELLSDTGGNIKPYSGEKKGPGWK